MLASPACWVDTPDDYLSEDLRDTTLIPEMPGLLGGMQALRRPVIVYGGRWSVAAPTWDLPGGEHVCTHTGGPPRGYPGDLSPSYGDPPEGSSVGATNEECCGRAAIWIDASSAGGWQKMGACIYLISKTFWVSCGGEGGRTSFALLSDVSIHLETMLDRSGLSSCVDLLCCTLLPPPPKTTNNY